MNKRVVWGVGLLSGLINGLLGSGGGMLVVPFLQKIGVEAKHSHATAIAICLPLTVVSVFFYLKNGHVDLIAVSVVAASGMVGGWLGAKLLGKIPDAVLKLVFGSAILATAIRMFF